MRKKQVKQKTTLPQIPRNRGRSKGTEPLVHGSTEKVVDASQIDEITSGQRGRDAENREGGLTANPSKTVFVPVKDSAGNELMPTTPSRARRWIKSKKATGYWNHGIYCVRLNVEPSARNTQQTALGIDPGSKWEGYTVKSKAHTFLNINADAVTWVKENEETSTNLRRTRRNRSTPCRKPKSNKGKHSAKFIPPSTKARWNKKLEVSKWLRKMFPITDTVVEDVAAKTMKNGRKWNKSFSPLEVGKAWFYKELSKVTNLTTKSGWETKLMRDELGLKKSGSKKAKIFEAHAVDSWVLANSVVGGHAKPDNTNLLLLKPLRFFRRQLHVQNFAKGGLRKNYGGTISEGFKRGSLVTHPKYGLCFVGGASKGKVSLHDIKTSERLCQNANPADIKFIAYNYFTANRAA